MCGILGIFDLKKNAEELRPQALQMSRRQRHRGPDWSGIYMCDKSILVHERLAIVDPASGKQPLFSEDGQLVLAVNGEIYNHRELRRDLGELPWRGSSDTEVLLEAFARWGIVPTLQWTGHEST